MRYNYDQLKLILEKKQTAVSYFPKYVTIEIIIRFAEELLHLLPIDHILKLQT